MPTPWRGALQLPKFGVHKPEEDGPHLDVCTSLAGRFGSSYVTTATNLRDAVGGVYGIVWCARQQSFVGSHQRLIEGMYIICLFGEAPGQCPPIFTAFPCQVHSFHRQPRALHGLPRNLSLASTDIQLSSTDTPRTSSKCYGQ